MSAGKTTAAASGGDVATTTGSSTQTTSATLDYAQQTLARLAPQVRILSTGDSPRATAARSSWNRGHHRRQQWSDFYHRKVERFRRTTRSPRQTWCWRCTTFGGHYLRQPRRDRAYLTITAGSSVSTSSGDLVPERKTAAHAPGAAGGISGVVILSSGDASTGNAAICGSVRAHP